MKETFEEILNRTISFDGVHSRYYSQWKIFQAKFGKSLSGIYFLQRIDKKGKINTISRLIGEDKQAILYIGESTNLTHRLGILINLLNRTATTGQHSMGLRYQKIAVFKEQLKAEHIKVRVFLHDNPRTLESKMLEQYLNKYGELPPLNNSK